jgi:hypothetical protein
MDRYVLLNSERLPYRTTEQRNAIAEILSKQGRVPRIAIVWSDMGGTTHAVEMVVVKPQA